MFQRFFILLLPLASLSLFAQSVEIVSGPMPGYSELKEAGVWLQLNQEADVSMEYWDVAQPEEKYASANYSCKETEANTARLIARNLEPGTTYGYTIKVNGKRMLAEENLQFKTQELWRHRKDPPAFSLALGSCAYINEERYDRPGKPYGSNYGIFDQIAGKNPDLMLWLGDNIYLREPDWGSWSGYMHRYSHMRQLPEIQKLLKTTHHYAIWDDHDFGPNDANGSWIHKDWALESFRLFWMNPSYGWDGNQGITTAFSHNDVDFFLLDNRYYRTAEKNKNATPQILGDDQIEWLIQALQFSKAKFKLVAVGGQVLNTLAKYENHAVYAEEREYLLKRIAEEEIKGVVFLTGDRHHTELSQLTTDNGIDIYDLTISPLTSRAYNVIDEANDLRVEGTFSGVHNFAILQFSGSYEERVMKIEVYDSEGAQLWTKDIVPAP